MTCLDCDSPYHRRCPLPIVDHGASAPGDERSEEQDSPGTDGVLARWFNVEASKLYAVLHYADRDAPGANH